MSDPADAKRAGEIRRLAEALSSAIAEAVHGGLVVQVRTEIVQFVDGRTVTQVDAVISKPL